MNLVFVWADEGTELKVDVPVVFKGEENCPGLKKGRSCFCPVHFFIYILWGFQMIGVMKFDKYEAL